MSKKLHDLDMRCLTQKERRKAEVTQMENTFIAADVIYIDTSSLMNIKKLKSFVNKIKPELLAVGKIIDYYSK